MKHSTRPRLLEPNQNAFRFLFCFCCFIFLFNWEPWPLFWETKLSAEWCQLENVQASFQTHSNQSQVLTICALSAMSYKRTGENGCIVKYTPCDYEGQYACWRGKEDHVSCPLLTPLNSDFFYKLLMAIIILFVLVATLFYAVCMWIDANPLCKKKENWNDQSSQHKPYYFKNRNTRNKKKKKQQQNSKWKLTLDPPSSSPVEIKNVTFEEGLAVVDKHIDECGVDVSTVDETTLGSNSEKSLSEVVEANSSKLD